MITIGIPDELELAMWNEFETSLYPDCGRLLDVRTKYHRYLCTTFGCSDIISAAGSMLSVSGLVFETEAMRTQFILKWL